MNSNCGWLRRWEDRQQAKFDRQSAERPAKEAAEAARNVKALSPSGVTYSVRSVKRGDWLVEHVFTERFFSGGEAEALVAVVRLLMWLPVALARRLRRQPVGRTIGVIHDGKWFFGEVAWWRENVPADFDDQARVAELAEQVRRGSLPVKRWYAPWRRL